jgi:hypothetical protein
MSLLIVLLLYRRTPVQQLLLGSYLQNVDVRLHFRLEQRILEAVPQYYC